jgi:hypothetical protein
VTLQLVARPLLLIASPAAVVALVALGGRESVHLESFQDPPHPGAADRHVVKAGEVHGNLGRAEVVLLAQPDDHLDHLRPGHPRGSQDEVGLSGPVGVEGRTPPTIATWISRGRNSILEQPRPVEVLHNGTWYRGDLTVTRYKPTTGWWGFARFIVGVGMITTTGSTSTSCDGCCEGRAGPSRSGRLRAVMSLIL